MIELDAPTREKLLRISAATIDRLLAPERRKLALRARSGTQPGTLLKHQIPIRTFAEWDQSHLELKLCIKRTQVLTATHRMDVRFR